MPHCTIEYSSGLDTQARAHELMQIVFNTACAAELFQPKDIKTRVLVAPYSQCAGQSDALFVHITFKLLAGRSPSQKQQLAQQLFDAVKTCLQSSIALSVDIQDMDKDCYVKGIT